MTGIERNGVVVPTVGHPGDALNALRYIMDAYEGEPLFVIRGRDRLAIPAIENYGHLTARPEIGPGMTEQVFRHRRRFFTFEHGNGERMKWPEPFPGWVR